MAEGSGRVDRETGGALLRAPPVEVAAGQAAAWPPFVTTIGLASELYEVTGQGTAPGCIVRHRLSVISSCDVVADAWSWRIRRGLEADAKATSPHN